MIRPVMHRKQSHGLGRPTRWWAPWALLVGSAAMAAEPDGLMISEQVAHYGLLANTPAALRDALHRGVEGQDLQRVHGPAALTLSELRVDYRLDPESGRCRISDFRVHLDLTIKLPTWQPARRPGPTLAARWDRLYEAMVRHEDQHRRHALEAASNLHAVLQSAPRDLDCGGLERLVGATHLRELVRLRMRDRLFDLRDRHSINLDSDD
jgi:predicted secreted Zn-dependent protease